MGWFYSLGSSRSELIRELTAPQSEENGWSRKAIKHCAVGNVLWIVWEITAAADGSSSRYIHCDVMVPHKDGWGYKPMSEKDGPQHHTCPLSYLEMTTVEDPEWRNAVRDYWAKRKANLKANRELKVVGRG